MTDQCVTDVLAHTQDMMMAVIEGQWETLMALQECQDKMLRQLFSKTDVVFSVAEKDDLAELQSLNQEIQKAVELHRAEVANELRTIRQGKAKASAYQSI